MIEFHTDPPINLRSIKKTLAERWPDLRETNLRDDFCCCMTNGKTTTMFDKLLICLLIIFPFSSWGQSIRIIEQESSDPIIGATISSHDTETFQISDGNGTADISAFRGSNRILIRSLGYETFQTSWTELESLAFSVVLNPTLYNLDHIVVSASRWRQSSDNVPAKIVNVSTKEVAFQNPQTSADLLALSGKVFIQKSQQGGGSPMIRGFATNRLIYTVDGVRMNTAIFRGGNIQNVINIDPFSLSSVEVLFGPGSVTYGSDAVGGVMSFETLQPSFSQEESITLSGKIISRFSSANKEKTGHFDINFGGQKWASTSSFSYWDYGDLMQGSKGPDEYLKTRYVKRIEGKDSVLQQDNPKLQIPSTYSQLNLMQKVRFQPNEHWDFQYGFHHSQTSSYGRYDRHNRVRDGQPRYAQWDYGPQLWRMNLLSITHKQKTALFDQMAIRMAAQRFEESRINRALNSDTRSIREEGVRAYSLNLDFTQPVGRHHRLFYGAEYVIDDINSTGKEENITNGSTTEGSGRYPQSVWQSIGIYMNDEFKISEKSTLHAGLRYARFKINADFDTTYFAFPFTSASLNNGALTGSIGIVVRPTSTLIINANASTAYRAPNVDDIGKIFDSEPGAVTVPNPDLDAEYTYNVDLGFTKILGENIKIDMTGFYTFLDNALVRRNDQLNELDSITYDGVLSQVQSIQNAASAKVYGIQAGVEFKFINGFSITSDLNYQKGEEELDDGSISPSRHIAPLFGVSRIAYQKEALRLEINTQYQGKLLHDQLSVSERGKTEIYAIDINGETYAPSWYTLNFKSSYQLRELITLNLGLENITDQRYRPYSSGISGAGRNLVVSVRWDF